MANILQRLNLIINQTKTAVVLDGSVGDTPFPQSIALYILNVDSSRQNEIITGFNQIRDFIIEQEEYVSDSALTIFFSQPIGGGKGTVQVEPILGNIPDNHIVIGLSGSYRTIGKGSQIFEAGVRYTSQVLQEQILKRA